MHIGLVTACYTPVVNGVTRMIALYKSHFEAAGHKVSIFTLGRQTGSAEASNIYRSPALPLGRSGYHFTTRYSKEARRKLAQVDIVHCHHLLMGLEFAQRYGQGPIVYTNHTRYDLYTGAYAKIPQSMANIFMQCVWPLMTDFCQTVIAPSIGLKKILRDFGVRRPIVVINNGIELKRFQKKARIDIRKQLNIPEDAILYINVGRMSSEKRPDTLLREFAEAVHMNSSIYLLLVGSGVHYRQMKRLVDELGVSEKVALAGAVAPEMIPDYLASADVFVTASKSEVHPLAVIEAIAAELPVVGISSPGLDEITEHEVNGYLCSDETGALAEAIDLLAKMGARRSVMANMAYKSSRRFDIKSTVAKTLALYDSLLSDHAGSCVETRRVPVKYRIT